MDNHLSSSSSLIGLPRERLAANDHAAEFAIETSGGENKENANLNVRQQKLPTPTATAVKASSKTIGGI
jgi:hypothetical protein